MWCEIKPVSVKQRYATAKTKRKSTGRKAEEGTEGSVVVESEGKHMTYQQLFPVDTHSVYVSP